MRARILSLMAMLFAASLCAAQFNVQTPCRIRIEVTFEDGREKVQFAEVELSDAMGTSSAMDRKDTDKDGRAEFESYTGKHRVRIRGEGIVPYDGDFETMPQVGYHIERIRVRRRLDASGQPVVTGMANAARLNIPDKAKKEFDKGAEAAGKQNWEEARKQFQAAIAIYPDYDLAYNGLGFAAMQLKDTAAARAAFEKATQLNDRFGEAQRNYARLLLAEKDFAKADEMLSKSLATDPDNVWALTNLAFAELQLKQFAEAGLHAQRVHVLSHEGMANAHMIAAYALDAQGKKAEAVAEFRLYLKEDPKGPNVQRAKDFIARLEQQ